MVFDSCLHLSTAEHRWPPCAVGRDSTKWLAGWGDLNRRRLLIAVYEGQRVQQ